MREGPPRLVLGPRALNDFELLSVGGLDPLRSFMARADYLSCLESMRLATGALFPIPFTLPVHEGVNAGARLSLTHPRGDVLATLDVEEVFEIDPALEARALFGSVSEAHPYES